MGRESNLSGELNVLRQLAEQTVKPEVDKKEVETIEDARILLHELQIHQIELEMQNEELRATRQMLEEERNKYADLYDFAPISYFTLNLQGIILEVNLNGSVLLGRERKYLILKPLVSYLANESHQAFYQALSKAAETNEPQLCEVILREAYSLYPTSKQSLGEKVFLQLKISPAYDKETEKLVLRCAATDISLLKQTQVRLEYESRVNEALAKLAEKILGSDSINTITDEVQKIALNLTGSSYGFVSYFDQETGAMISPTLSKDIWDNCNVPQKQFVFNEYHGLWGWVVKHKAPLLTNQPSADPRSKGVPVGHVPIHRFLGVPAMVGDQLLGMIAVANANQDYQFQDQDTLERVADLFAIAIQQFRAVDLLKQRTQELIRSNQELEEFAYVASHDLQEPLRKIRSFTELLQKQLYISVDERARKYMDYVVDAAQRMQELINDLLEYSRLGRLEVTYKSVDMEAIFDKLIADLSHLIEESGSIITHDPLPEIKANPIQMERLLKNLVTNAIKFRSNEPPQIHITTYQRQTESAKGEVNEWVFSVKDNGIGIHPDYHERIFQLFQRLHPREEYPGTGMGLAICKKIVEKHGGNIWVESQEGKGATFYFTIPAL